MLKLILGVLITLATAVGSIFAGNFTMGDSASALEYGQGVYKISACDDWVRVNLSAGATGEHGAPEGLSALPGVVISSLDTRACANTEITISAVDQDNNPLAMFSIGDLVGPADIKLQIDSAGHLSSSFPSSVYVIDQNPQTADFTITFVNPAILANSIGRLNIQTTST